MFIMTRGYWFEILLVFILNYPVSSNSVKINCTHLQLQSKVPKPQLKYMLNGQVHVIWQEKTSGFNYTAYSCHTSLMSFLNIPYPNSCPQFHPIVSCNVTRDVHQCSMEVSQYIEYTVYLSADHQGCQLRGGEVKIRPSLSIAYPGPVPKLNVYSKNNDLIIEWIKASGQRVRYVRLLYSLRCQKLEKLVSKPYYCCIQVRLPYGISPYYSEVCKTSQSTGI
ncbi:Hypothetical predicted protein [Paramuricea clavata]|nr:Hypothetical predicted protein [Paramuricea clavata]